MEKIKILLLRGGFLLTHTNAKGDVVKEESKAGVVYSVAPAEARRLIASGVGDPTPINVAFHSGDTATYNLLLTQKASDEAAAAAQADSGAQ